ncbi:MAG: ATP-binding protein [Candidatus Flemingibacterium sp.]|nr:ATP-binding protein [Candidatus Flemingibacterium sp.]
MPEMNHTKIPKRVLSGLLASISAGVVPRMGAPYIAIGRNDEIEALLGDLEAVNDGGGSMRFIIGKYGSGKSFLIQLVRGFALEKGFVTADADLSPERRICGAKGTGIATYRELIRNLASKSSPDGGAMPQIIARWLSDLQSETAGEGLDIGSDAFTKSLTEKIYRVARSLEAQIGGFDFASVITAYYKAYLAGDEEKKSACLRWLRGEYSTKTEARNAVGVPLSGIIDDDNWYEYIKLLAVFFRHIGYRGFVVFIDECVNLYKITNRISRENNYEKLLSMFNDTLQGKAEGLALIFGGTPQFLEDTRRGLFSYEALRSRLSDGQFQKAGYKNLIGPVIRLRRLSDDELFALIARITNLHAQNYNWTPRVTDEDMAAFLKICLERAGADTLITPREIIRDYMTVLNILFQNPETTFSDVVGSGVVSLKHGDNDDDKVIGDDKPETGEAKKPSVSGGISFDDIEL